MELEGLQYVAVSNFFMGLFLITFALDRSGGVTGTVMLVSLQAVGVAGVPLNFTRLVPCGD